MRTIPPTAQDDRLWGAFSEAAPWTLDREAIDWLPVVERLRAESRAEVPRLVTPSKLPPGTRVGTVAAVLGRAVAGWSLRKRRGQYATPEASRAALSLRLRNAAERLGPSYIKLGQIISSGEGLFPTELVDEFKKLRDQVPAEPFEVVQVTIEEDLGCRLVDVFEYVDREPLAAASIAQVHAARLRTGEDVVIKVQRPEIGALVRKDLEAMAWLAPHLVGRIPVAALANPVGPCHDRIAESSPVEIADGHRPSPHLRPGGP